ncbi:MAG: LPS assembly lipoprotein LptE [Bdellovibrionales bacterium]
MTALLCALLLSSCAYQMGIGSRSLPGGYRQLAIPVFSNKTQEVGAEVAFTNAMIREFEQSQIAEIVPVDNAPLKLEGEIESVKYGSRSAAQSKEIPALPQNAVLTTSYQILVTMRFRLRRVSDQAVLWEGSVNNEKVYSAPQIGTPVVNSANVLYNQSARQQSLTALAKEMMEEAHDRMTENF